MEPRFIENDIEAQKNSFGVLNQLRFSLQLLASDADVQANHFPPPHFFSFSFEMIDDFVHWAECVHTYWKLSQEQIATLKTLSNFLENMDWSPTPSAEPAENVFLSPLWNEIRHLARITLEAFDWSLETP